MEMSQKRDDPDTDKETVASLNKMATDLWGASHPENLPPDLAEYWLIRKTKIPLYEFFDDGLYNDRDRGKLIASVIIENQLDFLRRFAEIIEQNKRGQKRKESSSQPKPQSRARQKRPRTTNRYRTRRR